MVRAMANPRPESPVEIGALTPYPQLEASELNLVELVPDAVEGAVQDHHQPAVEGAEEHVSATAEQYGDGRSGMSSTWSSSRP